MPQYMLLIYGPTEGVPAGQQAEISRWEEYTQGLQDAAVLVGGAHLHGVEAATTVRVRDGETLITDGPFAVTKEFLAGYYMLECPDLDVALKHAALVPHLHYGSVEVRPLVDTGAPAGAEEQAPA